jgi:hypothetical protein
MTEPDPHYDLYRRSKAGEDISNEWGSHRNIEDVCWGFWRIIGAKTKHDDPVAIYGDNAHPGIIVVVGSQRPWVTIDNEKGWHSFLTWRGPKAKAVTKAEWSQAVSTGFWPEDGKPAKEMTVDERLGISTEAGGNDAPIEEALADQIAALAEKLAAAKEPTTQDEANALSGDLDRMRALLKKATEVREEEYRPHKEAADGVSRKWAEIMAPGQSAGTVAEDRRKAFLKKEDARLAAEAAAENERRRKEAEAERIRLQREAEKKGLDPATVEPPKVDLVEPERATAGSQFGRKSGLREYTVGKIVDLPMLANALLFTGNGPDADLLEYLQKRADAAAKAGNPLPGTEITKVKR